MKPTELAEQGRKLLAFDEAMGKLKEAGVADAFIAAMEKDPDLMKAIEKMGPGRTAAASTGWSCCITVRNPM